MFNYIIMVNGITLGIVIVFVLLIAGFILTLLINAFLIPLFKTPSKVLEEIVDLMELVKEDSLVDLGSGDGSILFKAYRVGMCRCTGYDISPIMLIVAQCRRFLKFPLTKDIVFEAEDIYRVDLDKFTKVYCYLDQKSMDILKIKLKNFIDKGGEVYSYRYGIEGIEDEKKVVLSNGVDLYIYI